MSFLSSLAIGRIRSFDSAMKGRMNFLGIFSMGIALQIPKFLLRVLLWLGNTRFDVYHPPNLSADQFRFYSTTCEVMIAYRMHPRPRLAQRALGHSTQRPLHGPCSQLKGGYRHFCILPKFLLDIIVGKLVEGVVRD